MIWIIFLRNSDQAELLMTFFGDFVDAGLVLAIGERAWSCPQGQGRQKPSFSGSLEVSIVVRLSFDFCISDLLTILSFLARFLSNLSSEKMAIS